MGCPSRLNQTSTEAGCFSAAVHIMLRLFFNQDTKIFCGASYLTVEDKQNLLCNVFLFIYFWFIYIHVYVLISHVAGFSTCVPEYNRPLGWCTAGVSYLSVHPNVNRSKFNQLFLIDITPGRLNATKFSFTMDKICRWIRRAETENISQDITFILRGFRQQTAVYSSLYK